MALLTVGAEEVYYLGYRLALSPAERRVLACLAESDAGQDTAALAAAADVAQGSVAALVRSLNEKTAVIGGRTLILSGRGEGYRLCPFP